MAIVFLLLCDGLPNGQSPGKRLLGIKVAHVPTRRPCDLRSSAIRNLPVATAAAFLVAPYVAVVAVPIVLFELYMSYTDALGIRIGDVFADTQVIDAKISLEAEERVPQSLPRRPVLPAEVGETIGARSLSDHRPGWRPGRSTDAGSARDAAVFFRSAFRALRRAPRRP